MFFNTALVIFSTLASVANTVPNISPRAEPGLITDCIDVTVRDTWLVGSCFIGEGTARIQSSVYLSSKITNNEGIISWKPAGAYGGSCKDCKIINGSSLNCQCYVSGQGSTRNTTLNLDEHIHNYNGHLLSDQFGTPVIPATSTVAVPADFSWSLSMGNTRCYTNDPKTDVSFCNATATDTPCSPNSNWASSAPAPCYAWRLPVSAPIWQEYEKLNVNAPSEAIDFMVYDNMDCGGEPIDSIKSDQYDTCKLFPTAARGIKTVPLWNADIS